MVKLRNILSFYPLFLRVKKIFILKEYLQCVILDILYRSPYGQYFFFLGGTCLRLIHDNQRFSEDLDFDNTGLSPEKFHEVILYIKQELQKQGYQVEIKEVCKSVFHCYIKFPALLYHYNLSGHKNEKILISLDTCAHDYPYDVQMSFLDHFDIFTPINTLPLDILFAQKVCAILNRKRNKGRDFFDLSFLMSNKVTPNYNYLQLKAGIRNKEDMKEALLEHCKTLDMEEQAQDVKPFVFQQKGVERVRYFTGHLDLY